MEALATGRLTHVCWYAVQQNARRGIDRRDPPARAGCQATQRTDSARIQWSNGISNLFNLMITIQWDGQDYEFSGIGLFQSRCLFGRSIFSMVVHKKLSTMHLLWENLSASLPPKQFGTNNILCLFLCYRAPFDLQSVKLWWLIKQPRCRICAKDERQHIAVFTPTNINWQMYIYIYNYVYFANCKNCKYKFCSFFEN